MNRNEGQQRVCFICIGDCIADLAEVVINIVLPGMQAVWSELVIVGNTVVG